MCYLIYVVIFGVGRLLRYFKDYKLFVLSVILFLKNKGISILEN